MQARDVFFPAFLFGGRIQMCRGGASSQARALVPRALVPNESGAAAIEFALVAPVFVLLVFGMIAYAVFFGAAHSVQELAADAARVAVAGINDTERKQLVTSYITNNGSGYIFVDPQKLTFTVGAAPADANQLAVSVSYDSTSLPIWTLLPTYLLPDPHITRRVSIRIGGV